MSHPTNRLNLETSPYLLQHAKNPVAWQPWDEAALELARQLDRPIFLSIGYSACHWCHVMEHESFENHAIAQWMNEHFINIKVDREERPDLDQIYMTAVTTMTGSGGWPMSVFLTPELKPFYGGTYWPPESRYGRPGFLDVLRGVHDAWVNRREAVEGQAKELTAAIQSASAPSKSDATLGENLLQHAMDRLVSSADREWGGFGRAPKFPHPMDLRLLLRLAQRFSSPLALSVVTLTLDKMATGGIYDHLGGGFARYSTDERWLVPHFEKMLYDNAQLVPVYLEAWQITGSPLYLQVVRETLDYILREMTSPEGPFYSTQDADSEGVEGKFFVWTLDEIQRYLDPLEAMTFACAYDVSAYGNWEHVNILNCPRSREDVARQLNMELPAVEQLLANSREKLFAIRAKRIWPGRDEKMLASWNGLMIAAMAQAGAALQEPTYIQAAARAANFLTQNLLDAEGKLCHSFQGGIPRFNGYLDDYAAMIDGLLELAQATGESGYIENAMRLATRLRSHFAAPEGGYYFTSHDHESLIVRQRDQHDNATPSGNSLSAYVLVKLARMTGDAVWEVEARKTLQAMSTVLERLPMAAGQALLALDWLSGPSRELVFCEGEDKTVNQRVLQHLGKQFLPRTLRFVNRASSRAAEVKIPSLAGKTSQRGEATLYVCSGETCQAPLIGEPTILAAKY